jgi:catechol 2,3-dioxygenase-like lactoylglutathione lyase family enzyme
VLELELLLGPTAPASGEDLSRALGVPDAVLQLAIFKVGEGSLELLEYGGGSSSGLSTPAPLDSVGAAHLAFLVDDIETTAEILRARGVRFLSEIQVVESGPLAGWRWVYFTDPDGITLEIIQVDAS